MFDSTNDECIRRPKIATTSTKNGVVHLRGHRDGAQHSAGNSGLGLVDDDFATGLHVKSRLPQLNNGNVSSHRVAGASSDGSFHPVIARPVRSVPVAINRLRVSSPHPKSGHEHQSRACEDAVVVLEPAHPPDAVLWHTWAELSAVLNIGGQPEQLRGLLRKSSVNPNKASRPEPDDTSSFMTDSWMERKEARICSSLVDRIAREQVLRYEALLHSRESCSWVIRIRERQMSLLPAKFGHRLPSPAKHIRKDVQPFTCPWERCRESKMSRRKTDWARHENKGHQCLVWWTRELDDCCYRYPRRDNSLPRLVREREVTVPKVKTKAAVECAGSVDPTWATLMQCRQETTEQPVNEPCCFRGKTFPWWEELTVHLAKYMEHISLPVLQLVAITGTGEASSLHFHGWLQDKRSGSGQVWIPDGMWKLATSALRGLLEGYRRQLWSDSAWLRQAMMLHRV